MKSNGNGGMEQGTYKDVPVQIESDYIFRNMCPSVSAIYHSQELELGENSDNPLILALPPLNPMQLITDGMAMTFTVPHAPSYRKWPLERKLLAVNRVSDVLVLTVAHVEMLGWLHIALRHRYQDLMPTRSLKKRAQENYVLTQAGTPRPICPPGDSHAACKLVFGISGAGKTTLAKMVLSTFPMIVEHQEFQGVAARFVQVVWVLVSCPPNGSVLTLMKGILYWFDLHFRTHYVDEVKYRSNTADYILKVDDVLRRHFTGVLVIDEIQFALKTAEKTQLIDFLTNLLNSNHCTFILLGTPDAKRYIVKSLRTARRVVSDGFILMDPFPIDEQWTHLAKAMINIDFLPLPPIEPDEIIRVLHDVSAGLPAFAKLAWKLTQYMGLRAGEVRVTPALIREAVKVGFGPVKCLLHALRTRDYITLAKCEDLATADVEAFRERIERERRRRKLGMDPESDGFLVTFSVSVAMLIEMGRTQIEAESLVRRILETDRKLSSEEVIRRALTEAVKSPNAPPALKTCRRAKSKQT
ncbi:MULTISPECIES: ATP-binding protein [unclassified Burkholderia]|uniref:ATP-binding protein n=1 Tax=unclassified Burkholderia TaxID=2613784 RepID=UPI002AB2A980|nr:MULTISPECIES: ATP-binding protein [unclassified Burkholderia]